MNKSILVDSSLDYEITFQVKGSATFSFGIIGFDQNDVHVDMLDATTLTVQNLFFKRITLSQSNRYYFFRGIIYNSDQEQLSVANGTMECGLGINLVMPENIKYIVPYIVLDNRSGSVSNSLYFYDLKLRPINFEKNICGFINLKNIVQIWAKNNSGKYNDSQVEDIVRHKLINYNQALISKFI